MDIEELPLGARAYGVLKDAGIDTVEDLCLFTAEQLLQMGNFGQKSLAEVKEVLKERSLVLHPGPADPRLTLSFPGAGTRFNLGLSVSRRDRECLAAYTIRELTRVQESVLMLAQKLTGQPRRRLLLINGHIGMLQAVHKTVLGKNPEQQRSEEPQGDSNMGGK
jgi:hypothetical protein